MALSDANRAWLESAIAEAKARIEWNEAHGWFDVSEVGEWADVTAKRNAALQDDIAKWEALLSQAR